MRRGAALLKTSRWGMCLLLVLAAGCGKKNVGTVSGVVKYEGKPLPGGFINFNAIGADNKVADVKTGPIGNDGTYNVPNVPVGKVKITVQGPAGEITTAPGRAGGKLDIPVRGKPPVTLPIKYGTVDQTDLEFQVQQGPQTHEVDLK